MAPVVPAARISRPDPHGARERPARPEARSPNPARTHRIVVAGDPDKTGGRRHRDRGGINGRRRRRRINRDADSDPDRQMGREERASREQQQRQKFDFHVSFSSSCACDVQTLCRWGSHSFYEGYRLLAPFFLVDFHHQPMDSGLSRPPVENQLAPPGFEALNELEAHRNAAVRG
jgi:hypothetical protein